MVSRTKVRLKSKKNYKTPLIKAGFCNFLRHVALRLFRKLNERGIRRRYASTRCVAVPHKTSVFVVQQMNGWREAIVLRVPHVERATRPGNPEERRPGILKQLEQAYARETSS